MTLVGVGEQPDGPGGHWATARVQALPGPHRAASMSLASAPSRLWSSSQVGTDMTRFAAPGHRPGEVRAC